MATATLSRTRLRSMPEHVEPMLATSSVLPGDPQNHSFEYKWDGVRALAYIQGKKMHLESRNLLDITSKYIELDSLPEALGVRDCILDGEIVALDDTDRPSFALLQERMHVTNPATVRRLAETTPVLYVLFDVLHLDGTSLMHLPYTKRREKLEELTLVGQHWRVTPAHVGQGATMLKAATENQIEGIVAKRVDSTYEPGRRSPDWRKIKIVHRQEFVVGGWIDRTDGLGVGSMLLGYYDEAGKLQYAGGVGTGFTIAEHERLIKKLKGLEKPTNPFAARLPKAGVHFVRPSMVIEVEFRRWPDGGNVQHASYKGIRADKDASQVVKEFSCTPHAGR